MDILKLNKHNIDKRISMGLELIKQNYEVKEIDTNDFKYIHIQDMDYTVRQYQIKEVGNLLIMECKDSPSLQMDSFVLTPYYKNLPLFSTDYIYIKENRNFLNEIYNLVATQDDLYNKYIDKFASVKEDYKNLPDMDVKECWYDDIRPVCIAKNTGVENDDKIINLFIRNLEIFMKMEKESPFLTEDQYKEKWKVTQDYTDGLVDSGGVSTDVFKAVLGADKTKQFFNCIFFAPELYKK